MYTRTCMYTYISIYQQKNKKTEIDSTARDQQKKNKNVHIRTTLVLATEGVVVEDDVPELTSRMDRTPAPAKKKV